MTGLKLLFSVAPMLSSLAPSAADCAGIPALLPIKLGFFFSKEAETELSSVVERLSAPPPPLVEEID